MLQIPHPHRWRTPISSPRCLISLHFSFNSDVESENFQSQARVAVLIFVLKRGVLFSCPESLLPIDSMVEIVEETDWQSAGISFTPLPAPDSLFVVDEWGVFKSSRSVDNISLLLDEQATSRSNQRPTDPTFYQPSQYTKEIPLHCLKDWLLQCLSFFFLSNEPMPRQGLWLRKGPQKSSQRPCKSYIITLGDGGSMYNGLWHTISFELKTSPASCVCMIVAVGSRSEGDCHYSRAMAQSQKVSSKSRPDLSKCPLCGETHTSDAQCAVCGLSPALLVPS